MTASTSGCHAVLIGPHAAEFCSERLRPSQIEVGDRDQASLGGVAENIAGVNFAHQACTNNADTKLVSHSGDAPRNCRKMGGPWPESRTDSRAKCCPYLLPVRSVVSADRPGSWPPRCLPHGARILSR
jgi:hypothetical protein